MSLDWHTRYETGRPPTRTLRRLTPLDIPAALALAAEAGWDHAPRDFERLLDWCPEGCFCLEEDGRGVVGLVTTITYGTDLGWIGTLIVAADRQRQGLGAQLMRAALDYLITCQVQRIMLDATEAGRELYRRMGFRQVGKIERWEGRASTYLGPRAQRLRPQDLPDVLALDQELFGTDRAPVLRRFFAEFPELAWIDRAQGQLEGYLFGRRRRQDVHLGPWMSWSTASAERLLRTALEQLQGQHVTLNIPDHNGRSLILASNHNLRRTRVCTRMIYGDAQPLAGQPLTELAIAGLATG